MNGSMVNEKRSSQAAWLVYDGDCPICRRYARYVRLRDAVGELRLVDARKPGPLMDEITAAGLNIDQGMVLKFEQTLYYGADAMRMVTLLSTRSGWFNRACFALFGSRLGTRVSYPIARSFRNALLRLLGISFIENLKPATVHGSRGGRDNPE
jgi:predicted DCC family thiol-disulfide oxidoreductase YuxK